MAADILKEKMDRLVEFIGKSYNFIPVTDSLFGESLIEDLALERIKQRPITDRERGSEVVHELYARAKRDGAPYVLQICHVLEKQEDSEIKKIGAGMRSQLVACTQKQDRSTLELHVGGIDEADTGEQEITPTQDHDVPDPPEVPKKDSPPKPKYAKFKDLVKNVNIIIMTATEVEQEAVMANIKPDPKRGYETILQTVVDGITIYLGIYGQCEVALLRTDQGLEAGEKLEVVQKKLKAQYVISVGICYGLNEKKAGLGDVIVSSKVVDISTDRAGPEHYYKTKIHDVGKCLGDMFKQKTFYSKKETVKIGEIVTRPTLLENHEIRSGIQKQYKDALAGEMEASGIMRVAHKEESKFEAIVIKAIVDWGVEPKESYRKWQPYAAFAAAEYVLFHLESDYALEELKKDC